jgi:hypothetical protein
VICSCQMRRLYRWKKFDRNQEIQGLISVVHRRTFFLRLYHTFSRRWKPVTQLFASLQRVIWVQDASAFAMQQVRRIYTSRICCRIIGKAWAFFTPSGLDWYWRCKVCSVLLSSMRRARCVGLVAPICIFACSPEAKWTL